LKKLKGKNLDSLPSGAEPKARDGSHGGGWNSREERKKHVRLRDRRRGPQNKMYLKMI